MSTFCGDMFSAAKALKRDFSRHDVPPHPPVTHKAEPGILERRRPVVFKEEMPNPCESVPLHQSDRDQPPDLRQQRRNHQGKRDAGTHKMQSPRNAIGMLAEIKRIEVCEGA